MLVEALATAGQYMLARELTGEISSPAGRTRALVGLAVVLASAGQQERAMTVAEESYKIFQSSQHSYGVVQTLPYVASAWAAAGDYEQAEKIARSTTGHGYMESLVLAKVAGVLAALGQETAAHRFAALALVAGPWTAPLGLNSSLARTPLMGVRDHRLTRSCRNST